MITSPFKYFIKIYYSFDLKPHELKRMLNLWIPFIFNRIKIISVSNDFRKIDVSLKLSFWNRNPGKAIWGGGRSWGTPGALVEAKTVKKLRKRYVYSEIWVFRERRTPQRSDEPDDIPFGSFDGKRKKRRSRRG